MSTTFANSIDSNPIYADRAENDKDGNRIDQTYAKSASLATVATTGAYSDLSGTPSIPTKTSDLTNDSNFITLADVPAQVQSDWSTSDSSAASYIRNKPSIPTVDQTYNAASANAQSGTAVAQAIAAIPSASYTAGDGIDITANEVSVKAGTGLEIADVSGEATENLVSSDIKAAYWDPSLYIVRSLCPLTSDLLTKMAATGGLRVTLQRDFWVGTSSVVYACIYTYKSSDMIQTKNRLILGSQLTQTGEYMPTNTVVTFDTNDINSASNVTLQQVQSNISNYRVGLIYDGQPSSSDVNSTDTSVVTATYSDAAIILDALCVSNPLPASTVGDAGKYLKVDANGDPEWATGGGGGGGVNADWAEDDPLEPSYIENKPVPKTLVAGTNITISENSSTLTVSATWQNAQADWTETDPNEPAYIAHKPTLATVATSGDYTDLSNTPTVDQTYDGTSANAQSGVAVASGISDAVAALPTNLTSAQIQALKVALGVDETVLYENSTGSGTVSLSEDPNRFERLGITYHLWNDNAGNQYVEVPANQTLYTFGGDYVPSSGTVAHFYTRLSYSTPTLTCQRHCFVNNGSPSTVSDGTATFKFLKVVGIRRIASN